MEDTRQYNDYVVDVYNKLETSGHSKDEINSIVKDIDQKYNNIDYAIVRKGWKYLIKHFTPELKRGENIYFTRIDNSFSCMSVKNDDGTYSVTFSFVNDKEQDVNLDYKKYLIYNYFKNKYTYRNIVSTSYLNSIVIANNKNYKDFPKCRRMHMTPQIILTDVLNYPYDEIQDVTKESYFNDCYKNYTRIREEMKDKFSIVDKDIRFYSTETMSILVVRNSENDYDVTFSFVNPKDFYHLDRLTNDGDYKHIMRYCAIRNKLLGKFTYNVKDVYNSINSVVNAYNKNRLQFPSYYHDVKMTVIIATFFKEEF